MPSRRNVLIGTGAVAAAGAAAVWSTRGKEEPVMRPAGVPLSPFDEKVTSEEVTAGLDLTGTRVLVTGATSGLGLETMRVLALRGAHVYGTGRTLEKAEQACASMPGQTTPVQLELTDFDSVVACAATVAASGEPLDVLVCNAGIMALPELEQVYGLEKQFVTNHLGHFLLTNLLLEQVKAAPQGRIVSVSSSALKWADPAGIEWDNLSGANNYDARRAYGQSKLANCLMTIELARRLQGTPTTANSMNPGPVLTDVGRHAPGWLVALGKVLGPLFMAKPDQGASTICYLAAHPAVADVSGYYFINCSPVALGGNSEDLAMAARLWDVSTDLVKDYLPAAT
ncbi:MAG: SDR family NAD(P)-dependent oxidoreductase [Gammaproteobacteria bacterium]|jgi:NAD(P)-dependent dehydrogenase (short-subunit alcohol dehydrogenase family)|nr:SDR family NAD(P)-dependent oxidoreductase [Gammaproteobacteria bacterium]